MTNNEILKEVAKDIWRNYKVILLLGIGFNFLIYYNTNEDDMSLKENSQIGALVCCYILVNAMYPITLVYGIKEFIRIKKGGRPHGK